MNYINEFQKEDFAIAWITHPKSMIPFISVLFNYFKDQFCFLGAFQQQQDKIYFILLLGNFEDFPQACN